MREFFLIRHAQSLGNIGMDGSFDPDLSPTGHAQAGQCAQFMRQHLNGPTLILASPFKRCLKTAEAIARFNNLEIALEPALHEYFKAEWFPVRNEVEADVAMRMSIFRNRLLGVKYRQEKIICVGHWASIIFLAEAMCKGIVMDSVSNAGVTKIIYERNTFLPVFVNNTEFQSSAEVTGKNDPKL